MPVSSRPSLRALARELGTSHQLLGHYLKEWDKWQSKEYFRQAMEIRARAIAEGRLLTQREEQQVNAYTGAAIRTIVLPALLDNIEQIEQDAKRGPLNRYQIRMLKILAREFPEARELLQKCSQSSVKNQKNNLPPSPSGAAKSFRRE